MEKDTLILKDETVIELEAGASLVALQVKTESKGAMSLVWEKLTEDNLSEVSIKNGSGLTVGKYSDLLLVSETSVVNEDGTVLTTYKLREKTTEEKRLDALEDEQEMQNEAIADLGAATSEIAEQVEGA